MRKTAAAFTLVGAAVAALLPSTKREEGLATTAYLDPVGVLTWCYGDTGPVPNAKLTESYCSQRLEKRLAELCLPAAKALTVPVTLYELQAICDFAYNVGAYGAANSLVIRELNAGNREAAGDAFLNWYRAGGKDCRVRSNNCYGMWDRRLRQRSHFLTGIGL